MLPINRLLFDLTLPLRLHQRNVAQSEYITHPWIHLPTLFIKTK